MTASFGLRDFIGGAPADTLGSGITNSSTSIPGTSAGSFPAGGVNGDFFIAIGADNGNGTFSNLEVIRCASRSGNTFTVQTSGRGADNTTAVSHNAGETIWHCLAAVDAYEANQHIANTALDHHSQYLNTTRHDITARHTFGAAFASPSAPPSTSTSSGAGVGTGPARSDHTHAIGALSVVTGSYAAGSIATADIGALQVTAAKIAANTITNSQISAGTISSTELGSNSVTTVKITDANITQAKLDATLTKEVTQIVATTGAYSGTPSEGATLYATTPHQFLQYAGATDTWTPLWNMPWGFLTSSSSSTAFTTTGTHTTYQDEGLTATYTYLANREIKVTASLNLYASGGANSIAVKLLHGATTIREFDVDTSAISTSNPLSLTFVGFYGSSAVNEAVKVQIKALVGNTAIDSFASATYARTLLVEDIGPAGSPS